MFDWIQLLAADSVAYPYILAAFILYHFNRNYPFSFTPHLSSATGPNEPLLLLCAYCTKERTQYIFGYITSAAVLLLLVHIVLRLSL